MNRLKERLWNGFDTLRKFSPEFEFNLKNSLQGKLLAAFVLVAVLPLLVVGITASIRSQIALKDAALSKLVAVREIKATVVEGFFQRHITDVQVLAQSPSIVDSMRSMNLVIKSDGNRVGKTPEEQMAAYVEQYKGRPNLANAKDGSAYSALHSQLHLYLQKVAESYGYYDLFLINADSGVVEYTVAKAEDYGANLKTGPLANSNLGQAYRLAVNATEPGFTALVDFAPYGENQLPASFVAAPIFDHDGTKLGVLAFQMPVDEINDLMQQQSGLGETGESYLIGSDKIMRSDSRFSTGHTLLTQKIDTHPVNQALSGMTGVEASTNYRDTKVLSAYQPLDIPGLDWAIITEINQSEAFTAANALVRFLLPIFIITLFFVLGVAFWVSQQLTRPILLMAHAAKRLAVGDIQLTGISAKAVEKVFNTNDEIGVMGQAFKQLIGYFSDMAATAQHIADGDLTAHVQPRAAEDVFGHTFNQMIDNLRDLVNGVSHLAEYLGASAKQLTEAATLSGQTTQHVSDTIEQVAQGSISQTSSIEKASETLNQVVRAISGVSEGAQEQASAAGKTMELAQKLTDTIQSVAQSAQESAEGSAEAAQAAYLGAETISKSIVGMNSIKTKVGLASQKVEEMGTRSKEIGNIVETIDDIASQTNLLALNAAIEAARTGAHSRQMAEKLLDQQLIIQAKLIAELLNRDGIEITPDYWRNLARAASIDNICITNSDGVIEYSDDHRLLGFRFPDDPNSQAYEFRKLLHMADGAVAQPTQRRSIDDELYKYVGVVRKDTPGIVQVGFHANSVAQFQVQVGGFAVVADEVRKLAEKSAGAAKEISHLIRNIQDTVQEAIGAMQTGMQEVENGASLAEQAGNALNAILQSAETVNAQVMGIAGASDEMSNAANELSEGIETVSAVIEENTAATEEMSAGATEILDQLESIVSVAEENTAIIQDISQTAEKMHSQVKETVSSTRSLNDMAENLIMLMTQFHLQAGSEFVQQVDMFRRAHETWVINVQAMLNGDLHLEESEISDHTACTLGKWIYGRGEQDFADRETFRALKEPHAQLHTVVTACVQAYNSGDTGTAKLYLPEIETYSHQIIELLNSLHEEITDSYQ